MTILMERSGYRFVESDDRGYIEKFNEATRRWQFMYECDSRLQLLTAMEDIEYTKWLDPSGVPCYRKDVAKPPRAYYEL
jgi:hypothetical protein